MRRFFLISDTIYILSVVYLKFSMKNIVNGLINNKQFNEIYKVRKCLFTDFRYHFFIVKFESTIIF